LGRPHVEAENDWEGAAWKTIVGKLRKTKGRNRPGENE